MGTRILQGRDFTSADAAGAERVVLINRTMARRYWPDADAVGRHLVIEGKDCQVIGVTEDAAINGIHEAPEPYIYASFAQMPAGEATLIVETTRDAADSVPALRELVRSLDSKVRIPQVLTMRQLMHYVLWQERMSAVLGGTLSLMGIFLAVAGLYGVIAYFVFRRVREIGVRIALGARPLHVLRMVLGYGLRLALAGTLIGLIAAASATRVLAAYLYGVSATDPLTFAAACLIVIAFALAAGFVPARRACRVDPMLALRCE
jgi:putative ABC transport system permease protein